MKLLLLFIPIHGMLVIFSLDVDFSVYLSQQNKLITKKCELKPDQMSNCYLSRNEDCLDLKQIIINNNNY